MELKEFLNYVAAIATRCSGFIRSVGYVTHRPGLLLMMNEQETFLVTVIIPVIYNLPFTAKIKDINNCKDFEGNEKDFYEFIYFSGYNQKELRCLDYFTGYNAIKSNRMIYYEDNIMNIPGVEEKILNPIDRINIIHNGVRYLIPIGKSITNLNKKDTCALSIYNHIYNSNICNTVKYTIYKEKFKLYVDMWFNILRV